MKAPAFQFYAQDFLVGTMMMSAEQVGAYIRLLAYQWVNGGFPLASSELTRITGCSPENLPAVLAKFEAGEDGLMRNARLEDVRNKQVAFRSKQAENGKKGGRPRKPDETQKEPKPFPTVNPNTKPEKALQSSSSVLPPNPQRGNGSGNLPSTPAALRFAAIYGRRPNTAWSDKEVKAFKALGTVDPDELAAVESYYAACADSPDNICRTALLTLLNNFQGEVDRARKWLKANGGSRHNGSAPVADPRWPEFLKYIGRAYIAHQFAPEHLKDDFSKWKLQAPLDL